MGGGGEGRIREILLWHNQKSPVSSPAIDNEWFLISFY